MKGLTERVFCILFLCLSDFQNVSQIILASSYTNSVLSSEVSLPLATRLLPATSGHQQDHHRVGMVSEMDQATSSEQE